MVPSDETYIYSGSFRAIQDPYIEVRGERHENSIEDAGIQIAAEIKADNLVFTLYGRDYGMYDINLFINHEDCFELNGSELLDFRVDEFGNEEIIIFFNEDFWKKCYFDDDVEKTVSFILKSESPIF